MNLIAKKIYEARMLRGLSQAELAEQAHVNIRTIQRIESSETEPRGKTLNLICDALQINVEDLTGHVSDQESNGLVTRLVNGLFLLFLNLILMAIIGFMTLDSNSNLNSRFGAFLLSFFIPFFIVVCTRQMSGIERMLKFGLGFIAYFFLVIVMHGFPTGFLTGLFPCLLIALGMLYFGQRLVKYAPD